MSTPEYPRSPETPPNEPTTPPTHPPYGADPAGSAMTPPPVPPLPPAYGQPHPYAAGAPTDGTAIGAMVLGILGLVMMCGYGIGIIPSIIAIFLGRSSKRKIRDSQGQLAGEGMAQAGFIMGIIGAVISALFILVIGGFIVAMFATDCFGDGC
ncbi:DUF4190 domain-containing protein [Nocardioides sp.]|uniref:DUF4190 domain-containing protein n=1 Tax=Nocardioides sp. TaxID=35761 RepID=UPI002C3C1236|nr:DUF4190 domain-containing protein [Nocardioides sp.]HSX68250.1 DUF4190 domain-containing protein [Nocardioides sp.]